MCLAVPGKIMSVHQNESGLRMAKVNFAGVGKDVCLEWLPDAQVGEYVLVHVGFALSKVDEQDAEATLQILRDMGELSELENGEPNRARPS